MANFQEAIAADPEGCVIDVGAYSGLFTILALKAGAEEVIALEPNPQGHRRLCENVEPYDGYPPTAAITPSPDPTPRRPPSNSAEASGSSTYPLS